MSWILKFFFKSHICFSKNNRNGLEKISHPGDDLYGKKSAIMILI